MSVGEQAERWAQRNPQAKPFDSFAAGLAAAEAQIPQRVAERMVVNGLRIRNSVAVLRKARLFVQDEMSRLRKFGVDESSQKYQTANTLLIEIDSVIDGWGEDGPR